MARPDTPLAEIWAWLAGLVIPAGALVAALTMTLAGETPPSGSSGESSSATTTLVAGASALPGAPSSAPSAAAPTPGPRESLSASLLASPLFSPGSARQPATEAGADVAVAGIQVQAPSPLAQSLLPDTFSPLIGRVGGHAVPVAFPIAALVTTVAGFAWRVHTSAPWPSKNAHNLPPLPRRRSLQKRSALA